MGELASALSTTRGTPARLHKAGFGMVKAPKKCVDHVCVGLREADTGQELILWVWKFVKDTEHGPELEVLVLLHMDDFLHGGIKRETAWEELQEQMRAWWKWSEWEQRHLPMTGRSPKSVMAVFLWTKWHTLTPLIPLQSNLR